MEPAEVGVLEAELVGVAGWEPPSAADCCSCWLRLHFLVGVPGLCCLVRLLPLLLLLLLPVVVVVGAAAVDDDDDGGDDASFASRSLLAWAAVS